MKQIFWIVLLTLFGCGDPTVQVSKLEKPLRPIDEDLLKYSALGDLAKVKKAIEQGADLKITDTPKWTALHHAARWGKIQIVQYLIREHSLNPKSKNQFGQNVLHFAVWSGSLPLVQYLIEEQKIHPEVKDFFGAVPLHICAWSASVEIARYLLEKQNARIDIRDENKRTPLHWAAERFRLDIPEQKALSLVQFLVEEHSAQIDLKDVLGKTPRDLARDSFQKEIQKYLKAREQL